jgi:mono/diheme cytochrome c family protein
VRSIGLFAVIVLAVAACGGGSDEGDDGPLAGGRRVYVESCVVCHGAAGEGGVGPGMAEVVETFPSCDEQVHWITLGSVKWEAEVGPTYGAQGKEVGGAMTEFGPILTEAEIRAVAAYERSRFGGQTEADAAAACGVPAGNTDQ